MEYEKILNHKSVRGNKSNWKGNELFLLFCLSLSIPKFQIMDIHDVLLAESSALTN